MTKHVRRTSTAELETTEQRIIDFGHAELHPPFADNSVSTSKYTLLSFLPMAVREQFRKNGNVYFLCIGILMFLGYYTPLFDSAITPWTTLGPLALVVSVSVAQEGYTDLKRHRSDKVTNFHPCVVLRRAEELDNSQLDRGKKSARKRDTQVNGGNDVNVKISKNSTSKREKIPIAFESVFRMNIHAGDLVVVRNREMIPADLVLLASSNEGGSAYVETSSIDGETNLKLRNSPHLPFKKTGESTKNSSCSSLYIGDGGGSSAGAESFRHAIERIANISTLGHPDGVCSLLNPANADELPNLKGPSNKNTPRGTFDRIRQFISGGNSTVDDRRRTPVKEGEHVSFIATLTSEPPNTHVNNFSGKLTLPPDSEGGRSEHAPLNAENILLRGAALRNTEWVIGLACFTGADTKLVMNSVATPSKFSQLDRLINRIVFLILFIMLICVCTLGGLAVSVNNGSFNTLWFTGYNDNLDEPWPYFNLERTSDRPPPKWDNDIPNYLQMVFMFVTMLSNFVPLSLYVSVEMITVMMMLYVGWDLHMYHDETDTPAAARSTIVTDLGLVEYIFSDKTGTLTCNVMEFKRCSVDGHIFGMPIAKSAPTKESEVDNDDFLKNSVHPLKNLLAGSVHPQGLSTVAEYDEGTEESVGIESGTEMLTFNAEMFLRVMSICHTVVVEKDHDAPKAEISVKEKKGWSSKGRSDSSASSSSGKQSKKKKKKIGEKKKDGAPEGYAYQAESPDEGALVSAASLQISCSCPSLFEDNNIVAGFSNGTLDAKTLASRTAPPDDSSSKYSCDQSRSAGENVSSRVETWTVLAINKFDSDRKRMSVLVRSPPELGSVPMLLCKGADSSMLLEGVCEGIELLENTDDANGESRSDVENFQITSLLGIQAHLGEFASEGLRTLVLGVKILTDEATEDWLKKFKNASTSIEDRDKKLTAVACEIEKNLHIVGATAIEDRLQDGVPETIANLGKAGIKLWVLTGDKRETAIEIGYSTKVLTPKMHLTEVVDGPADKVKTLIAMELMRHIKIGNLPEYQLAALDEPKGFSLKSIQNCLSLLGHWKRKMWMSVSYHYLTKIKSLWTSKAILNDLLEELEEAREAELRRVDPRVQKRKVRECARGLIQDFWKNLENSHQMRASDQHNLGDEASIVSDDPPAVFERAKSAKASLRNRRVSKTATEISARIQKLALAKVSTSNRDVLDEEVLSMRSYNPSRINTNFDKKKRSFMERLFAVDKDVRHGRLLKHMKNEIKDAMALDAKEQSGKKDIESMVSQEGHIALNISDVKRGLVVEGAALKHILGDPVLEEMLFAVASCCESVIACRVSPIQKALLLKMVRKYVSPTPTTLAIGDGANDVGMIQEAHIGIGISGLEGQQAVNASDFSIAQFRYLESLLLIHGRWNFMRMSKTVLFFFYKNAALIGTLMVYSSYCMHSGTPLYDPWVISVFNFVGGSIPIICMGIFDRDLPRDYVLRNPEVYRSGPQNEFLSFRMTFRWVAMTIIQTLTIYHFTAPAIDLGGGSTSAFKGLMGNWDRDVPGDGEGGDLKVFGTTIYSNLIYVVTLKAFFETRSLIHGEFPTFTCRRNVGEGWPNRMGYTWVGVSWGSVIFYIWFLYMYELIGRRGVSSFFDFIFVTRHLLNMRSITWMVSILTPIIACIWDVTGKVFSNMYYPTQTQIHAEIASRER
ncbi:hypothetical protein ACHAXS_005504 [Conticribra weissflogii]